MTRIDIIAAVQAELDARAEQCRDEHLAIGEAVADRLGLASTLPAPAPDLAIALVGPSPAPVLVEPALDLLDLGLWVDDRPALVLSPAYLARLYSLPLSHLSVMIDGTAEGLDHTWTPAQLGTLATALPYHDRGITIWPEPSRGYLAELRAALPGLLRAIGRTRRDTYVLELDLEGAWKRGRVDGFPSLGAAGLALTDVIDDVDLELGAEIELEVTTFPAHLEASADGTVLGEDRLFLQTYPVAEARGEKRDFEGPLGPSRRPYEDVLRARAHAEPGVEICAGLAAWEQDDWPGAPEEAMRLALESARRAGVRRVRWWSARHMLGAHANSYAARAIEAFRPLSLRASG